MIFVLATASVACLFAQEGSSPMSVGSPKVVVERDALALQTNWLDESVELVIPAASGETRRVRAPARTVIFRVPGGEFPMSFVEDPSGKAAYIVRGQQSFYVLLGDRLLSCRLDSGPFRVTPSVQRVDGSAAQATRLATDVLRSITDAKLLESLGPRAGKTIDLRGANAAPPFFFTVGSTLSSQGAVPTIKSMEIAGTVLKLDLESPGGRYQGTFWIDVNDVVLLRANVQGQSPLPEFR
jgi:hypothetical protein